ncbi:MAG: ABC transporter permease [Thermodesulfobacteriota bacterium]
MPKNESSKVGLFGVIIGLMGFVLGDFVINRPNRLASGQSLSVFEALPAWQWGLLGAGFLCLTLVALFPTRKRALAGTMLPPLMILALLWAQGTTASLFMESGGPFTRVSIGSSLWIAFLGLFIVFDDMYQRLGAVAWYRLFLAVAFVMGLVCLGLGGQLNDLSLVLEFANRSGRFFAEFKAHLFITGMSVGCAALLGFPLGVLLFKQEKLRVSAFSILNIVQTVPSLALFGLLIAPLAFFAAHFPVLRQFQIGGIGWAPAVIALTLYSLLPIVRNTFSGFDTLHEGVLEAGQGMGMSRTAMFFRVELPIAAPIILNGLRIATVQNVGNTAVAALIGAGGFGVFIFQGLGQAATDLVLLGAVPTITLAVVADQFLQLVIKLVHFEISQ